MKRLISIFLAIVILAALCACEKPLDKENVQLADEIYQIKFLENSSTEETLPMNMNAYVYSYWALKNPITIKSTGGEIVLHILLENKHLAPHAEISKVEEGVITESLGDLTDYSFNLNQKAFTIRLPESKDSDSTYIVKMTIGFSKQEYFAIQVLKE